ncbi:MAG: sigma-70 family RNA polymerase sigma factor [Clostridia bacterium]|nr:sigma-70 family RNA polymerase sigma factor [Clostridia bacterium]
MDKSNILVINAKNGDESAFSELSLIYAPLINSISRRYFNMCEGASLDDFVQEAQMALYDAVKTYNVDGKVTFGAYAKACVRNRLVSCVRRIKSKKRNKSDLEISCEGASLQDTVVWRDRKLLTLAENTLSSYEKRIFQLYVKGCKVREISKSVGKSEKSVNNAIYRIRSKLRDTVK